MLLVPDAVGKLFEHCMCRRYPMTRAVYMKGLCSFNMLGGIELGDILYENDVPPEWWDLPYGVIIAEGITTYARFERFEIERSASEILDLLLQLPNEFLLTDGGGYPFNQLIKRKDGVVWGNYNDAQRLLLLGLASGYMKYCNHDRATWVGTKFNVPMINFSLQR